MRRYSGYAMVTLIFCLPLAAATLPRIAGELRVDGDITDTIWRDALRVDRFYDVRSSANSEPVVRTIVWLGYDDRYLYVAARNEDPRPREIRSPLVPRDRVFGEQDLFHIDIDAQDDGKAATMFRVNARGVQMDGVYTESNETDDWAPDFDFESATKILADAWQVEMRIPLSSIRYAQRDPQTWRITIYRVYPREHRYRFRSSPVEKGQTCWLCAAPRFDGIRGLKSSNSLVVTPYVTTRAVAPPREQSHRDLDGGLDAKWLAGPNLTIDATINPDFSQVEADVTELSVNQRFAIFYPEKRPFFMEGTDLLSSPIQAIHTRTLTAPSWGARITGHPGKHAYTLIAAGDDGRGSIIIPGPAFSSFTPQPRTFAVFSRYRYSIGSSYAGLLTTSRSGGGYSNHVAGPDAQWWLTPEQRITAQLLWSRTRDDGDTKSGHAELISWNRTSTHLAANAMLQQLSNSFRADSGFVPQTGVRVAQANILATANPKKHFTSLQAGVAFERVTEIDGASVVSSALYPRLLFEGWRGTYGELQYHPSESLRARDGSVRKQNYATLFLRFLPSRHIPLLSISVRTGGEVDVSSGAVGDGTTLSAFARLQPAPPLYAELTSTWHRLAVGQSTLFDAKSLNARLTWVFTPRSFARIVADGQRIRLDGGARDGFLDTTVLYGYRLTWQTSVFAGYGDSRLVENDTRLGPPRKELFLKASYAVRSK